MRIRLVPLLLAATCALLAPSLARAGTYTVLGCQTGSGAAAPMDGWQSNLGTDPADARWKDNCPSPTVMALIGTSKQPFHETVSETLSAPPGMTIEKYTFWRAVRLYPSAGFVYAQSAYSPAVGWKTIEGCTAVGKCGKYGNYLQPTANVNHDPVTPPAGTTAVRLSITCEVSPTCPTEPNPDEVWLFKTSELLEDNAAPQITQLPTGPLVSGGVLSGDEAVSIGATDQESGVYQAEIEVDGKVLDTQVLDNLTGTCGQPFTVEVPCPISASGTIVFNTALIKQDGTHSLRIIVTDPAGNMAYAGPFTIRTSNSPCSPIPAATGMALNAAFVASGARKAKPYTAITVRYSRRATVQGTLRDGTGAPVPDASVCVAQRRDTVGAAIKRVATLETNAAGAFSYRLSRGPSRTLYFIHRVPGGAIDASVHVAVHVPVHVHLNRHKLRNGQVMRWKGTLPGPVPSGLTGLMQVWRGSYWETFKQISIRRSGKWTASYRFLRTFGRQQYVFRMLVRHQSQYPYAVGWSNRIRVVVTG